MTKEEALKVFRSYKIWDLMDNFTTDELQEMIDAIISTPSLLSNLDEAAEKYFNNNYGDGSRTIEPDIIDDFKAGAEWMAEQGVTDAIEGEICGRVRDHINVKFQDGVGLLLTPAGVSHIPADVSKYNIGDKVVVQIRKK